MAGTGIQYNAASFAQAIVYANELRGKMNNTYVLVNSALDFLASADPEMGIGGEVEEIRNSLNEMDKCINETLEKLNSTRTLIESTDSSVAALLNHAIVNEINYIQGTDKSYSYYSLSNDESLTEEDLAYVKEHCRDILYSNSYGSYGGNQGGAIISATKIGDNINFYDEGYYKIISSYFPNMTNEEIYDYYLGINEVGCGYTAVANYIFESYADKPEQFEKDFGFPMYKKNAQGQIQANINYLVTDIYCYTNKNGIVDSDNLNNFFGIGRLFSDDPAYANPGNTKRNIGMKPDVEQDIIESERYSHTNLKFEIIEKYYGRNNNINNYKEQIKENLDKGNLISLSATDYTLYHADANNNIIQNAEVVAIENAPHAMTITGINDNGDLIVSTWGGKYILDLDSVDPNFGLAIVSFDS